MQHYAQKSPTAKPFNPTPFPVCFPVVSPRLIMITATYKPNENLIDFCENRRWFYTVNLNDVRSYADLMFWKSHLQNKVWNGWAPFEAALSRACMRRFKMPLYRVFHSRAKNIDWTAKPTLTKPKTTPSTTKH